MISSSVCIHPRTHTKTLQTQKSRTKLNAASARQSQKHKHKRCTIEANINQSEQCKPVTKGTTTRTSKQEIILDSYLPKRTPRPRKDKEQRKNQACNMDPPQPLLKNISLHGYGQSAKRTHCKWLSPIVKLFIIFPYPRQAFIFFKLTCHISLIS